jgi:F420-non-reducing hydrogenase large subunit
MAFRAYDPCHGCATHSMPGQMPIVARIIDSGGQVIRTVTR